MKIKLGNRTIGDGQSVYIIAEAGVNHNGDIKLAKKMIDLAKNAGADCIKFQTFKAEELIADRTSTYTYRSQGKEVTESQFKMFKRREFSASDWQQIIDYCQKRKVVFATTPQNPTDLDFILSLTGLPFIKVGSDDLTALELLSYYAKKDIPLIISAGMASGTEIAEAVATIRKAGNEKMVVLHCVSSYSGQRA